ncbi:tRNA pseudouridine synthase A [Galendromus occidentalis]|uniref:Pseudouridylate synthase 1 homolog n=1 Tax=Galendromus occidentalis TaxID=34638 RepID=A0AAJ7P9Y9_9ACAR|nr:tRNA pseudouridine synthase A [Galendromus occidentalis]
MLCAEIVRNRPAKFFDLCRLVPLRSWCTSIMPELAEKREAESGVVEVTENQAKKPKLDEKDRTYLTQASEAIVMNNAPQVTADGSAETKATEQKWKLKKFAMCLTYCGKGYLGLQKNPGFKTIEGDLLEACVKAGVITPESAEYPQGISFQRAARTDKGVSAARQILSLKLPTTKEPPEEMVRKINEHLVDQIRVIGLKRVTKNFNSKNNADARTYLYICPTFAFTPHDQVVNESYRLPSERVEEINRLLKMYIGCHNFHNFTSGKLYTEASAKRVLFEVDCSSPFMVGKLEYVQFRLKGQSFMLHQIRKMVGTIIGIMRGYTTEAFITRAFGPEKLDVPKAPPLGLMLDTVHYTRYDDRYGGDGSHETITWEEYQDVVHNFKVKHILPNIWDTEENGESMIGWLADLDICTFDLARVHESVPKTVQDAPEDDVHSDDESDVEGHADTDDKLL